ncbi:MAG: 50S ribosomal protein L11 methyltransferase [Lachnospiraceae bacterium]|nr:50S ribosomal protein L11 methyltransferase [Lachnospiraceae bacterium]
MKWNKYTINTTTEAQEIVTAMLADYEIYSVEIDNNVFIPDGDRQGGVFEELQPDMEADDGTSHVSFYLEEGTDATELLENIKAELEDMRAYTNVGAGTIDSDVSDEVDWRDKWKEFFSSFEIGNIFIKPTWEETPEDLGDKTMIEIDPGISFGTGKHESTQLVIKQLQQIIGSDRYITVGDFPYAPKVDSTLNMDAPEVLDVGCGSGILSVVALKLGASHVTGTDIEQDCIDSTYSNFDVNHLAHNLGDFYVGNLIDDVDLQKKVGEARYDIVVANILADIIIPMAPALAKTMKDGAYIVTSGIIDFKEEEVKKALMNAGLTIVDTTAQGEWRSVTARK